MNAVKPTDHKYLAGFDWRAMIMKQTLAPWVPASAAMNQSPRGSNMRRTLVMAVTEEEEEEEEEEEDEDGDDTQI